MTNSKDNFELNLYWFLKNAAEMQNINDETKDFFHEAWERFKEIYSEETFRHEHSFIANQVKQQSEYYEIKVYNIEVTVQSFLSYIEETLNDNEKQNSPYAGVRKLADYILLECQRQNDLIPLQQGAEKLERIDELAQKVENNTVHSVTILSIFSGIVLAFSGGLTLIGNTFNSLSSASIFRLTFFVCFLGFIIYNVIISIMFIVTRLNGKDMGVACKKCYNCMWCEKYNKHINIFCQAYNKYPHITFIDIVLLYKCIV